MYCKSMLDNMFLELKKKKKTGLHFQMKLSSPTNSGLILGKNAGLLLFILLYLVNMFSFPFILFELT